MDAGDGIRWKKGSDAQDVSGSDCALSHLAAFSVAGIDLAVHAVGVSTAPSSGF
jgi:hypothetical protein